MESKLRSHGNTITPGIHYIGSNRQSQGVSPWLRKFNHSEYWLQILGYRWQNYVNEAWRTKIQSDLKEIT